MIWEYQHDPHGGFTNGNIVQQVQQVRAVRRIGCPSGPVSVPGLTEFPTANAINLPFGDGPIYGHIEESLWHWVNPTSEYG
jgi:hypothetical protein